MAISDAVFENLTRRKDSQVDALLGRDQPFTPQPDPARLAAERHDAAIARARTMTDAVLPERGPRPPAPVQPADPLDTNVILGDVSYSLFFLVRSLAVSVGPRRLVAALVAAVGPETVLSALCDLGHVRGFSE